MTKCHFPPKPYIYIYERDDTKLFCILFIYGFEAHVLTTPPWIEEKCDCDMYKPIFITYDGVDDAAPIRSQRSDIERRNPNGKMSRMSKNRHVKGMCEGKMHHSPSL